MVEWAGTSMRLGTRDEAAADESFEVAFKDLFTRSYRVARRILGGAEAAEDIAAEALSRTYARWSHVSQLPYRDAWVLRVTINLALNSTRRRRLSLRPAEPVSWDDASTTRLALVDALRALPTRQREVMVLRHLAGLSESEVAARLDLSLGTVKTHLRRGREKLKSGLVDEPSGSDVDG
jgi:RNA polymerase sigma factor (sigma-70 family)